MFNVEEMMCGGDEKVRRYRAGPALGGLSALLSAAKHDLMLRFYRSGQSDRVHEQCPDAWGLRHARFIRPARRRAWCPT